MATTWSNAETLKLIEVWGEDVMQGMPEGSKTFIRKLQGRWRLLDMQRQVMAKF